LKEVPRAVALEAYERAAEAATSLNMSSFDITVGSQVTLAESFDLAVGDAGRGALPVGKYGVVVEVYGSPVLSVKVCDPESGWTSWYQPGMLIPREIVRRSEGGCHGRSPVHYPGLYFLEMRPCSFYNPLTALSYSG